ncbi:uncharacterized protein PRCAT00003182001 [Priceomyces carsonii]|uniref:uncharacterized protein n=1 Tax=Priceomyces carsonii TaxID=28549 RepID=UPI002EDA53D4|nr:unnamed protein product [Priceomyces carsonii]
MKLLYLFAGFLSIIGMAAALGQGGLGGNQGGGGKTETSVSATSVWITITTDGNPVTVKSIYKQTFMKTYSAAETSDVKSGNVGLGTIDGSVGKVRSYDQVTILSSAEACGHNNAYAGLIGSLFLILGALL